MKAEEQTLFISSVKNTYMIVCIPKNASTWLGSTLKVKGQITKSFNIHNKVCILRDPIERWLSGVAQYLSSEPGKRTRNKAQVLDFFISAKEGVTSTGLQVNAVGPNGSEGLDNHTIPQNRFVSKFISKSDESSTTWFYLDDQFTENFYTWASNNKITIPRYEKKINVSERDPIKSDLVKYYRDLINQYSFLKNKIKYFYQEDFDLIERVNFYGK
jgi:hypothetical protein